MPLINRHNIKNTLVLSMRIVALLPFSADEDRCQMLKLPVIRDLNHFNWYITNASDIKDLELDDKESLGFVDESGDISLLRKFIQTSNNQDLQRVCVGVKELKKICLSYLKGI